MNDEFEDEGIHDDDFFDAAEFEPTVAPANQDAGRGAFNVPGYQILEVLGEGGMGRVYKANHIKLQRMVAIKLMFDAMTEEASFVERFIREARAMAAMDHPNIIRVYDYGELNGSCYIIMEYVDGTDLRSLIKSGSLTSPQAFSIISQICDALQFAHEQGIVHRDIKPGNIMLDRAGRVKVADFGLAKLVGTDFAEDEGLTMTYQVMGTPMYMAPEQRTDTASVDQRADIYSLGVMFYEMLTGSVPLGRFEPPSKKVQVDERLDHIVLKAMEQEPSRRYQHISEMRTDLITTQESPQPVARSPQTTVTVKKRRSGWYGFMWVVALIWAAGLAGAGWWYFNEHLRDPKPPPGAHGSEPESGGKDPLPGEKPPPLIGPKPQEVPLAKTNTVETVKTNRVARLPDPPTPPVETNEVAVVHEPPPPPPGMPWSEVEPVKNRAENEARKLVGIDHGQGFGKHMNELTARLKKAQQHVSAKENEEAHARYTEVTALARSILELEKRRQEAVQARRGADQAQKTQAEVERILPDTWKRVTGLRLEADRHFASGAFSESVDAYLEVTTALSLSKEKVNQVKAWEKNLAELEARMAKLDMPSVKRYAPEDLKQLEQLRKTGRAKRKDPAAGIADIEKALALLVQVETRVQAAVTRDRVKAQQLNELKRAFAAVDQQVEKIGAAELDRYGNRDWRAFKALLGAARDKSDQPAEALALLKKAAPLLPKAEAAMKRARWESAMKAGWVRAEKAVEQGDYQAAFAAMESLRRQAGGDAAWRGRIEALAGRIQQDSKLEDFTVSFINGSRMDMTAIPAGSFMMGSPETEAGRAKDETRHQVHITRPFWMSKFEINRGFARTLTGKSNGGISYGDQHPAHGITWFAAVRFCNALNAKGFRTVPEGYLFRLPTEAEWEYACRAGTTEATAFGDVLTSNEASFGGGRLRSRFKKCGSYPANAWGLHDMHGSAWEWCIDQAEGHSKKPVRTMHDDELVLTGTYKDGLRDPWSREGPLRILRGGSLSSQSPSLRSANRVAEIPGFETPTIGLRVVFGPKLEGME